MSIASPILPARLEWRGPVPVSAEYGDVYFSLEGGLDETHYVFLEGNRLPQRFAQAKRFVIGELGFGTGLNVMAAWRLWKETAPKEARLHLFSIEKHPLTRDDLARAHAAWPMLAEEAARIQQLYPPALPGFHTLPLDERVTLTLCFGEALAMLRQMRATVDAWFLDGFSPARNGMMWAHDVLHEVGERTAAGGTAATFSAAGAVREALGAAGFAVEKRPGFGRKRHMVVATRTGEASLPKPLPERVGIIGGGIAGASAARALAEQGVRVTLLEQRAQLAGGASGTPAAILFPRLAKQWTPEARFDWSALYHLERLGVLQERTSGLVQLPKKQRGQRDEKGWPTLPTALGMPSEVMEPLTPEAVSQQVGVSVSIGGILIKKSGLMNLAQLVASITEHPFIERKHAGRVVSLQNSAHGWQVHVKDEVPLLASAVVLACGWEASALCPDLPLPLTPVRGQLTRLPVSEPTARQRLPMGYGGYLSPPDATGHHWLGATFERGETCAEVTPEGHAENLRNLAEVLPGVPVSLQGAAGWAGIRATSPDRLPIIGQAVDADGVPVPGLYLSLAHGSRGALSGPLGGAMLAAMITGQPLPVEEDAAQAFNPARFARRRS
jgi:tRNA 5-methylaminomethyl-2-thiouridine biosynthesis bifunctional protein